MVNDSYAIGYQSGPPTLGTLGTVAAATAAFSNAPFTKADINSTYVQARLVAAALKLRYLGTELNKGGLVYGLQEPTHATLAAKPTSTLALYQECQKQRVADLSDGKWHTVVRTLGDQNDLSFIDEATYTTDRDCVYKSDGVAVGWDVFPYIAMYVSSPVASQSYEYEAWGIVEYSGFKANPKTLTIPDPMGLKIAQASMSTINANARMVASAPSPAQKEQAVQKKAVEILDKSLPSYIDMATEAFSRYGPSIAAAAAKGYNAYKAGAFGYRPTGGNTIPTIELVD